MEKIHKICGKAVCMQLLTIIVGFEGLIFNTLAAFDVFPCVEPLNFVSRRKGFDKSALMWKGVIKLYI